MTRDVTSWIGLSREIDAMLEPHWHLDEGVRVVDSSVEYFARVQTFTEVGAELIAEGTAGTKAGALAALIEELEGLGGCDD